MGVPSQLILYALTPLERGRREGVARFRSRLWLWQAIDVVAKLHGPLPPTAPVVSLKKDGILKR